MIQKCKAGINGQEIFISDDENSSLFHLALHSGNRDLFFRLVWMYLRGSVDKFEVGDVQEFGENIDLLLKQIGLGYLGKSPLHIACIKCSADLIRTLIQEYKSKLDAKDNYGGTPFLNAAFGGNKEVVCLLLDEFGQDPNSVGYLGKTTLHWACESGNVKLVRVLIEKYGAKVTTVDNDGNTPLNIAAYYGNTEVALSLIEEFDCDVYKKSYSGKSLLHDACEGGSIRLVQTLLSRAFHCCLLTTKATLPFT